MRCAIAALVLSLASSCGADPGPPPHRAPPSAVPPSPPIASPPEREAAGEPVRVPDPGPPDAVPAVATAPDAGPAVATAPDAGADPPTTGLSGVDVQLKEARLSRHVIAQGVMRPPGTPPPTRTIAQVLITFTAREDADVRFTDWALTIRGGGTEQTIPKDQLWAYHPDPGVTRYWSGTVPAGATQDIWFAIRDWVQPPLEEGRSYALSLRLHDAHGGEATLSSEPIRLVTHPPPPGSHAVP